MPSPNAHSLRRGLLMRLLFLLGPLMVAGLLAGCSDRPPTVPVSGRVTVDGQNPPGPGTVYFTPEEAADGLPRRPGYADFDAQGNFQVKSFSPGDGLVPGKYLVRVECFKTIPTPDNPNPPSLIPSKYSNAMESGIAVEVPAESWGEEVEISLSTKP